MSAEPQHARALTRETAAPPRPGARARLAVAPAPHEAAEPRRRRRGDGVSGAALLAGGVTVAVLALGLLFPTERYLSPRAGAGYALGIAGGSAMLLLLVYPLRKRLRALAFLGTTKRWFQVHMALGIVGPVLILFHSNFSLGATNSNVALACMLVVAGSGLFGRYFYARIHHGLHGRKASLAELKLYADRLRFVSSSVEFLPGLVARIDAEEQRIIGRCEHAALLLRPVLGAVGTAGARRRLQRFARAVQSESRGADAVPAASLARQREAALRYIDDRLAATRRVVEFAAFERLFSLWHALHMPLFLMLLIAGVVHVFAVHLY